ncbi:hypothetical protein [Bacteriovorax sp. DB6_IX]|uniref:hypothetical protein n=1 Tax=Bacteriovorax sp. DB6_IX TaxID=1353530 RepID=UPI00038A4A46|nr:hypothetical protein [Bacteriovorax sp. DB6_IX]EQC52667.1 hypothetical protein M901_0337 [Bacteriovorax sp. DB6_IX]
MRVFIILIAILLVDYAFACPGCAGSMGNPKDTRLVYILAGFIVLTYIPFYILYRTIIKNRNLNLTPTEMNQVVEEEKSE